MESTSFPQAGRRRYARMLNARMSGNESLFDAPTNLRAVRSLERLAQRYKRGGAERPLREVVRLLVAASGHDVYEVRDRANTALERVFAPKPFSAPLATSFVTLKKGDLHHFSFRLPRSQTGYVVRLYTGPAASEPLESESVFADIELRYNTRERAFVADHRFSALGHYDYLVYRGTRREGHWLRRAGCSGRINVIPDVRAEIILEIFPDVHGHTRMYLHDTEHPGLVYNENGEVIRSAQFSDIAAHLEGLKHRYHITAVYLLGTQKGGLNREHWSAESTSPSPFAPVSLTDMEPSLGGDEGLRELVDRAHRLGIKVIVDLIPHLNRESTRVPAGFAVQCVDATGNLVVRASTDGWYGNWNDGKLLNYRKLEVWEWLAGSLTRLIEKYDIDGVRFDSCHAMPIMMKKNNEAVVLGCRRSDEETVEGTIIVNDKEGDHFSTTGYYECACHERIANPFHYYFMRAVEYALRKNGKEFFIVLGECYWGRERYLSRVGIIPYNSALFKISENILHGRADLRDLQRPGALYDSFLLDSLVRLCCVGDPREFDDSFAVREIAGHLHPFESFAGFLSDHLVPLCQKPEERHLVELGCKRALYHAFRTGTVRAAELHSHLDALTRCKEEEVRTLGKTLRHHMQRGPLVFISAEAEPFSKAGGIAEVMGEIPRELARLGENVYVITPLYRDGEPAAVCKMRDALDTCKVTYTGRNVRFKIQDDEYEVGVHYGTVNGVGYFLLHHGEFFDGLYWGYTAAEKLRRRIAFSRACAELIVTFDLKPMAILTNDAFAGIFNGIIRADPVYFLNPNFARTSFLHIVHNAGWQYVDCYDRHEQGLDHFRLFNLPYVHAQSFSDPIVGERINCMAAGVRFADRVITVSPKYAEEITVASGGLELVLRGVTGIQNGVRRGFSRAMQKQLRDAGFVETWHPRFLDYLHADKPLCLKIETRYPELLDTGYACESIADATRRGLVTRMRNKLLLQLERGFAVDPDRLLFTMIHRLTEQKGFPLLLDAATSVFEELGYQAIVGGPIAPFDQRGEELAFGLKMLQERYPDQVSVSLGLQDPCIPLLASDVFLMPSLYEPAGIAQLEALACGCFVIARATGGLQDTVRPLTVRGRAIRGNGFLFMDPTAAALHEAMQRCARFFAATHEAFIEEARRRISRSVYYWDQTARLYHNEIYSTKEIVPTVRAPSTRVSARMQSAPIWQEPKRRRRRSGAAADL